MATPCWYVIPEDPTSTYTSTATTTSTVWDTWVDGSTTGTSTATTDAIFEAWVSDSTGCSSQYETLRVYRRSAVQETEAQRRQREAREAEAERKAQKREAKRKEAKEKAAALLREFLSEKQWDQLQKKGFFELAGMSGATYRIHNHGTMGNITALNHERYTRKKQRLCAHPKSPHKAGLLPQEDIMLAQMLALQYDEENFLDKANLH